MPSEMTDQVNAILACNDIIMVAMANIWKVHRVSGRDLEQGTLNQLWSHVIDYHRLTVTC